MGQSQVVPGGRGGCLRFVPVIDDDRDQTDQTADVFFLNTAFARRSAFSQPGKEVAVILLDVRVPVAARLSS